MSEYAYLLARVRGKLARLVREVPPAPEGLAELLSGTSYAGVLEEGGGLSPRPTDALRRGFLDDVASLLRGLDQRDRILIVDLVSKWRLENLKLILRYHLRGLSKEELEGKLLPVPWERVDYGKLAGAPSLEAFINSLPWPGERAALKIVHDQVGEKTAPFPYEAALDSLYLERLLSHWRSRPKLRSLLGTLLRQEIFTAAIRLRGYGFSFPEIVNLIPGFGEVLPDLREIVETEEGWRKLGRWLARPLAQRLANLTEFDLDEITRLFRDQLALDARRVMVVFPLSLGIVVGYVILKEQELSLLIGLVEKARA